MEKNRLAVAVSAQDDGDVTMTSARDEGGALLNINPAAGEATPMHMKRRGKSIDSNCSNQIIPGLITIYYLLFVRIVGSRRARSRRRLLGVGVLTLVLSVVVRELVLDVGELESWWASSIWSLWATCARRARGQRRRPGFSGARNRRAQSPGVVSRELLSRELSCPDSSRRESVLDVPGVVVLGILVPGVVMPGVPGVVGSGVRGVVLPGIVVPRDAVPGVVVPGIVVM